MLRTFLKKVLPWLVATGIFYYLFRQYPPGQIYNSLKFINIPFLCAVGLSYFVLMFFLDTYSILRVLKRFGYENSFFELLPARGFTYLFMILNYAAGQAAFAFYQYRKRGIPIAKMLGIFGIIVVIDLYLLMTLAFVTTFFTSWPIEIFGMNVAHFVRFFAISAYASFALFLVLKNIHARFPFFEKLCGKNNFLNLMVNTGFSDYLAVAFFRLPVHVFIMCGLYLAIRAFNAHVPFVNVLSNIPIVFFIGALPITPGGIGSSNFALVEFFKPFITSAAITSGAISAGDLLMTFGLIWMVINYIMKAVTGSICILFVSKDLFKPTKEVPEEEAEEESLPIGGNF